MEIDDETLIPKGLKQSFLNLQATFAKDDITPYEDLEFRDLDYATEFGLMDLTPDSIEAL